MPLWFAAGAGGVVCIAPVLSGQIHLDLQRDVRRGPDGCLIFSFFFFFSSSAFSSSALQITYSWTVTLTGFICLALLGCGDTLQGMANVCLCPAPCPTGKLCFIQCVCQIVL